MGAVTTYNPPGYIYLQSDICGDLDRIRCQTEFQSTETFLAHLLDLHANHEDSSTRVVRVSQNLACRFSALQGSFENSDELMKYLLRLFSRTSIDAESTQETCSLQSRKKSRKSQPKRNVKRSIFHDPNDPDIGVESPSPQPDDLDLAAGPCVAVRDMIAERADVNVTAGVREDYKGIAAAFNVPVESHNKGQGRQDKHVPLMPTIKQEKDTDVEGPLCLRLHQPRSDPATLRAPPSHRPLHDPYPIPGKVASMRAEIHPTSDTSYGPPSRHGLPQWRSSSEPLSDARLATGSHYSPQKPLSLQVSPQGHMGDRYMPMESPGSLPNAEYQKMDAENNNVIGVRPYPILGKILDRNRICLENENINNTQEDSDGYNYVLNTLASPKKECVTPRSVSPSNTLHVPLQYPQMSPYSRPATPINVDEPEDLSFKTPDKDMPEDLTAPKLQNNRVTSYMDPTPIKLMSPSPVNQKPPLPLISGGNRLTPTLANQLIPTQIRQLTPNQVNQFSRVNGQKNMVKYDKNGNALLSPVFQFPNGFPVQTGIIQSAAKKPAQALIGQPALAALPPKFRPIAQKGSVPVTNQVSFVANAQGSQPPVILAASPQTPNMIVNMHNGALLPNQVISPQTTTVHFQHPPPPPPLLISNAPSFQPPSQVQTLSPPSPLALTSDQQLEDENLRRKRKRMDDTSIFRDPPESSLPFNGPHKFRFYCDVCDTGFTRRYTFNRHKCKGRVEKHYCQLCDKAYLSKYKLKDHILVKHEGQTVSCPDCGKRFSSRSSMEMHKKQQHEGQFSIFCKICGKGFNHTGHYYGHMNKHTNTKPFWCQQCGKRFYGSSYLHNHKQVCRSDAAEFNYACNQCDRKFKCELYLKKHQKVHETTPLIYQATAGVQMDADNAECANNPDLGFMDVGDENSREEGLIIDDSDDDDTLIIDCSTSPEGAAFSAPSEMGARVDDSILSMAQSSPRLSSVAHISNETVAAS